jgi:hypothetical protein
MLVTVPIVGYEARDAEDTGETLSPGFVVTVWPNNGSSAAAINDLAKAAGHNFSSSTTLSPSASKVAASPNN